MMRHNPVSGWLVGGLWGLLSCAWVGTVRAYYVTDTKGVRLYHNTLQPITMPEVTHITEVILFGDHRTVDLVCKEGTYTLILIGVTPPK